MVHISEVLPVLMEEGSSKIIICGAWLGLFGFAPGRKVVLDIIQGQITVKLVEAEDYHGVEMVRYTAKGVRRFY